jgi:malonyl CoA-acyl carrier protein transacylase
VVAANYNCPGQLVISGETVAVEKACEAMKRQEQNALYYYRLVVHSTLNDGTSKRRVRSSY